jgi:phosphoribosylanthranilate isomerase
MKQSFHYKKISYITEQILRINVFIFLEGIMAKIKICGLSRPADITMVNEALPDYIGFVFAASRRQVSETTAKNLKEGLDPSIKAVGVFVNEDMELILRMCRLGIIDIIQLHGDEDEEYIRKIKTIIPNPVIKAVRVKSTWDIHEADHLDCDYLLLDAYKEDQYGGNGEAFDWSVITRIEKPFFLAGGIHGENVLKALSQVNPYCIDVSSGVETDGYKDKNKVFDIIKKVRSVK